MGAPLKITLLSAAPAGALGSMGIYEQLVVESLSAARPELDVRVVRLLPRCPATSWARLRAIAQARWQAALVKADVIHLLDGSFGYLIGNTIGRRTPQQRTVVTVHDLIPALQAKGRFEGIARPSWQAQKLIASSLDVIRTAGGVVSVSQSTAEDVLRLCGRPVDVVLPQPLRTLPPAPAQHPLDHRLQQPFILHVGHNGFYKNRSTVIQAFSQMTERHPQLDLVLAGSPSNSELQDLIAANHVQHRVHWLSEPTDTDLAWLYHHAKALLFPSLYEGFGWPPLEAMHYNCPVISSTTGSLPEVCADAALLTDPCNISDISLAIDRLLTDQNLRQTMTNRGKANLIRFKTNQLAEGLLNLYDKVVAA